MGSLVVSKDPETLFIQLCKELSVDSQGVDTHGVVLDDWLAATINTIQAASFPTMSIHTAWTERLSGIQQQALQCCTAWQQADQVLHSARDFAALFADKLMLLVFGKFNAGKSSFCNLIAERFISLQQTVRYFHLENGTLCYQNQPFQEGSMETTAQIQGLVLADRIVLIDTPGLHSATAANAQLTQEFLDSADGMLWLSSSTSPGQVQELEEMAQELRRRKPVLPVITRSDYLEEDIVDDEIVSVIHNKSADNRTTQEQDVWMRSQEALRQLQLDPLLVHAPISVSVHAARAQGITPQALEEAGFQRVYQLLQQWLPSALQYKRRKSAEIQLHFLEEKVANDIRALQYDLQVIRTQIEHSQGEVAAQCEQIAQQLWRNIMPVVLSLLDQHLSQEQGAPMLQAALWQQLCSDVEHVLANALSAYALELDAYMDDEELVAYVAAQAVWSLSHYERIYMALESLLASMIRKTMLRVQVDIQTSLTELDQSLQQQQQEWTRQLSVLQNLIEQIAA